MVKNEYKPLIFPKFNQRQIGNIVNSDETWVNYFEPLRTIRNKIWHTYHSKSPELQKQS